MAATVKDTEQFGRYCGYQQIIVFGWDGKETHVSTWGKSLEDCDNAAVGANNLKRIWKWPESTIVEPPRVKKLQNRIQALEKELAELKA